MHYKTSHDHNKIQTKPNHKEKKNTQVREMSNGIGTSLERKKEKVTIFETPAGRERERESRGKEEVGEIWTRLWWWGRAFWHKRAGRVSLWAMVLYPTAPDGHKRIKGGQDLWPCHALFPWCTNFCLHSSHMALLLFFWHSIGLDTNTMQGRSYRHNAVPCVRCHVSAIKNRIW